MAPWGGRINEKNMRDRGQHGEAAGVGAQTLTIAYPSPYRGWRNETLFVLKSQVFSDRT